MMTLMDGIVIAAVSGGMIGLLSGAGRLCRKAMQDWAGSVDREK